MTSEEMREAGKVCAVAKLFMHEKMRAMVIDAAGAPILTSYSSDSTPVATKRRERTKLGKELVQTRSGRGAAEYFVQHAFMR